MYSGYMDNVRLWKTALDELQVAFYSDRHIHADDPFVAELIANYTFDMDASDTHGGAHGLIAHTYMFSDGSPGTFYEAHPAISTDTPPSAIYFDGVDVEVVVPYSPRLIPRGAMTFEAWIKPDADGGGGFLASAGFRGWGVLLMCNNAVGETKPGCCEGGTHVEDSVGFWANVEEGCALQPSSTSAVTRGAWNHVAVTVSPPFSKWNPRGAKPTEVCFYIDGEQAGCFADAAYNVTGGLDQEVQDFVIGGSSVTGCSECTTGGMLYQGFMDNVRLWDDAIDPLTLGTLFDKEVMPTHPYLHALIANYSFTMRSIYEMHVVVDGHAGEHDGRLSTGHVSLFPNEDHPLETFGTTLSVNGPTSFYFNGVDQYVSVPFDPLMAPTEHLTVEAWIKPVAETIQSEPIVVLGDMGWSMYLLCGGGGHLCCGDHVNGSIGFLSHAMEGDVCADAPSSDRAVTYGRWNHVAVTVDAMMKLITFYVNGEFAGRHASWDVGMDDGGELPLSIGNTIGCSECTPFLGYMDELRVFSAVVSQENILTWMNRTLTGWNHPDRAEVIAYYKFDATFRDGNILTDLGWHRFDGVIQVDDPTPILWDRAGAQALLDPFPAPPPAGRRARRSSRARARCISTERTRSSASTDRPR